jgi:hypothetical protein
MDLTRGHHEPLGEDGVPVRELHGDAAAERVAHRGGAAVSESDEQIADADRVGAKRVVAAQLGRANVPEQIGGENGEALGEQRHDRIPLRRRSADPVDQQDDRPVACRAVAQAVAMKNDLALARLNRTPPSSPSKSTSSGRPATATSSSPDAQLLARRGQSLDRRAAEDHPTDHRGGRRRPSRWQS